MGYAKGYLFTCDHDCPRQLFIAAPTQAHAETMMRRRGWGASHYRYACPTHKQNSRQVSATGRRAYAAIRDSRIEDYLFIGGDRMPAWQAAARLGVTARTIVRYRAALRQRRQEAAA